MVRKGYVSCKVHSLRLAPKDITVVKIDRGVEADDRCLFECVMQRFSKQISIEVRESLASAIETDRSVAEEIRKVWQSRNLKISLFGSQVTKIRRGFKRLISPSPESLQMTNVR